MIDNFVSKKIYPAIGYYGGKSMLSRRILQLAPPHTTYIEPFAGGLNVLLNKYRSQVEVASDLSPELINFYHILVSRTQELISRVKDTTFGKQTFYSALRSREVGDELTRALNFLIRQRMSFSGCGKTWAEGEGKGDRWINIPENLILVAERLKGVKIVLQDALEVIQEYDSEESLIYADPPYYPSTRVSPIVYIKELKKITHMKLLKILSTCKSSVILSGYDHYLYNDALPGWEKVEIDIAAFSSPSKGTKSRRKEILWVKSNS